MNTMLGMAVFALGGLAGATFLLPARGVKGWAYETWWFVYVFLGLIVCPPLICYYTVPDFWNVTMSAPPAVLVRCAAFGMAVYCSHGMERTHIDGLANTADLLLAYILDI